MGVKGLETFVRDNRTSLTKSISLPSLGEIPATTTTDSNGEEKRTPIIVDAWGIIFKLYLDTLPWTSGGEYLRYYKLVKKLVNAWRKVGLEPTFVFDGAAPPEKHNTILSRATEKLLSCQLFYTTSIQSRSSPSFSKGGKVVLPFFASQTFIFALNRLNVQTHFVPAGEADGICVSMAENLGGYIFGRDSDFIILIGNQSLRSIKGYVPIDMLYWIEGQTPTAKSQLQPQQQQQNFNAYIPPSKRNNVESSFQPVHNNRRNNNNNSNYQSSMIPSSQLINPTLVVTYVPPQALRHRLRLPATHLPLFASLCGTDYTPTTLTQRFYEPNLSMCQKIEKAARILREQLYAPQPFHNYSNSRISRNGSSSDVTSSNPGDQVVDLVKKVVKKMCIYPFDTEQDLDETVDIIIESALQYSLPPIGICCNIYPFCGELDLSLGCQTPVSLGEGYPTKSTKDIQISGKEAYSRAQRSGLVGTIVHGWLYPDRMYQWQVLEDISGPCLKASEGVKDIRRKAWSIADEGLGGLRWIRNEVVPEEEIEIEIDKKVDATDDQSMETVENDKELRNLLGVPNSEHCSEAGDFEGLQSEATTLVDQDFNPPSTAKIRTRPIREMTEYLRQGSTAKIMASPLPLSPFTPLEAGEQPICLRPIEERLQIYLQTLHSNTPAIRALPISLQPLVSLLRFCALDSARKASNHKNDHSKWRRDEISSVLRACIATYTSWKRELKSENSASSKTKQTRDDLGVPGGRMFPLLETRNSSLIAQIGSVWSDAHVLAQALLLLPEDTIPALDDEPTLETENGDEELGVTHIIPFIFISGITLHSILSNNESYLQGGGWKWSKEEEDLYESCWNALIDDLNQDVIVGLSSHTKLKVNKLNPLSNEDFVKGENGKDIDVVDESVGSDYIETKKNKKKKRRKSSGSGSTSKGKAGGAGSRFDVLEGLMD
ncbi:uncharacterized protein L201_001639 [Kwoniella dendrophila CBS 6074]|uniref:Asteroid domain-containing protein n=1 Tax=Kwoniella dendrophila CBS 6074 TaxID=1295534 RepID=A0AAX4JQC8_9TREE